jgi:hypothetical protein
MLVFHHFPFHSLLNKMALFLIFKEFETHAKADKIVYTKLFYALP